MKVLFYKGRKQTNPDARILDRLICYFDKGEYSHVEFITYETSSIVHTWGSHAARGGVSRGMYSTNEAYDVYELCNTKGFTHIQLSEAIDYYHGGYDFLGLPGAKSKWWPVSKKRAFCSNLIGRVLGLPNGDRLGVEELRRALITNFGARLLER